MQSIALRKEWAEFLRDFFSTPEWKQIGSFLRHISKNQVIVPPHSLIFNAFNLTIPDKVRVIILGQDPYHGPGQAHGLAFSVPNGIPVPPSLANIFKEIENDIGTPAHERSGDLTPWALQGVLLLNTILTVTLHSPTSHSESGWETFTDYVIKKLSSHNKEMVFMLWGNYAQKKTKLIDSNKHLILTSPHPSPLSAHKGWFGSAHFSKSNKWLISKGYPPIKW